MNVAEPLTSPCHPWSFGISSALPVSEAKPASRSVVVTMASAALITLLQIVIAVAFLAPEGPFSSRYQTLVQHDGYWFMNIVNRGYQTTVPPIDHKVMEVSNVAFFPAYPVLTAFLHYVVGISTSNALLIVAQAAAFGFWCYFFLFCERWNISMPVRWLGALAVAAHPGAFFLVAGYSESLFLMALLGFLYWSRSDGKAAGLLATIHGFGMSAARIVGIPCALAPLVESAARNVRATLRAPWKWGMENRAKLILTLGSLMGAVLFFLYCQLRWGHWDIYMVTQNEGWAIEPDYLAVFRPSSYHWLLPSIHNPTEASQMAMTLGGLMLLAFAGLELVRGFRTTAERSGLLFCAATIYFVSVSGVACVQMESMLRYEFCVHALIALAFLHFLRQLRPPTVFVRGLAVTAVVLACAASVCLQGWYVWNFMRGNWIA